MSNMGSGQDFLLNALIGASGGITSRTFTAPIERVRVTQQVQTSSVSFHRAFRTLLQHDGILGLWRGNGINSIRVFPNQCIRHGTHHYYEHLIQEHTSNLFAIRMVSGALAGLTATVGTYPADLVRSLLSVKSSGEAPNSRAVVSELYAEQGLRGFYRGCLMSCLGVMPYFAINVTSAKYLKEQGWCANRQLNNLVAGALAGVIAVGVTYPTDVIKRRIMVSGGGIRTTIATMSLEGVRSFYRGLGPALIRIAPGNAIQWAVIHELYQLING